jgi:hypothetical protein
MFIIGLAFLLTACSGGATPALAVAGQPTLVLIYTGG